MKSLTIQKSMVRRLHSFEDVGRVVRDFVLSEKSTNAVEYISRM